MEIKYYSGIGSRNAPSEILNEMFKLGAFLANKNFILRSGAAEGSDEAFEKGCNSEYGLKEIYLPWKKFNGSNSHLYYENYNNFKEALKISSKFHPCWNKLSIADKCLLGRNVYQVLGQDLQTLSNFVICYTDDKKTGGTKHTLRIAKSYNIPIFNFFGIQKFKLEDDLKNFLKRYGGIEL